MFFNRSKKQNETAFTEDLRATRKAGIRTAILVTLLVSGIVPAFCMMFSSTANGLPFSQHLQQMWSIALLTYPLTLVVAVLTILRKRGLLNFGNVFLTFSIVVFCGTMGNALGIFGEHQTSQNKTIETASIRSDFQTPYSVQAITPTSDASFGAYHNAGYSNSQQSQQLNVGTQASFETQQIGLSAGFPQHNAMPRQSNQSGSDRGMLLGIPAACWGFFSNCYETYGFRMFFASVLVGLFAGNTASRFLVHVPKNRNETVDLAKEVYDSSRRSKSA